MNEVAARLRKSRRWLDDYLKSHPYYRLAGRTKVFTEGDISRLIEALPCPSGSKRRAKVSRRTGGSEDLTLGSESIEALRLAREGRRRKSSTASRPTSNVVNLATRERSGN
jgi:hypothetical protein